MSLATKYRPQTFEDVCGQTITTTILQKVIENKTFKNCYIFSGASGCGKTTVARIFANAINNGIGSPIEIDGASIAGAGVEYVRAIINSANERAIVGEYKVYIIDECHALGNQAWQAFLKGIEECQKYTIFIFCTTNPNRLPDTILNRMQRYTFAPIQASVIGSRLQYICQQEGFTNYQNACEFISKIANGSMRNAISYLEQCTDYSTDLSKENYIKILGSFSYETMFKLTWALQEKNQENIFNIIEDIYASGQDLTVFISNYFKFILDLEKYILFKRIDFTAIPAYLATADNAVVQHTVRNENSYEYFKQLSEQLLNIKTTIKNDPDYKSTIEVMLLKFIMG